MNVSKLLLASVLFAGSIPTVFGYTFDMSLSVGGSSTAFPASSQGLLVADLSGGNFASLADSKILNGAISLAPGSLIGSNLLLMATTTTPSSGLTLSDFGDGQLGFTLGSRPFDTNLHGDWTAGDRIAIIWFLDGTSNTGSPYEWFTSFDPSAGTIDFQTPGPGEPSRRVINLSTNILDGTTSDSSFLENGGTIAPIPEPSVILLIAFAPILVKFFRVLRARVG